MQKNVLITSVSTDLGTAMSEKLLDQGWHVFAGYETEPNEDTDTDSSRNIRSSDHMTPVLLDLSREDTIDSAFKRIISRTDHLDMIINMTDTKGLHEASSIRDSLDFDDMLRSYESNAIGQIHLINTFLPLLDQGTMKRLCFITSKEGCISLCQKTGQYSYAMSRAAANMAVALLFNALRPEGYTFRLFDPACNSSDPSHCRNAGIMASQLLAYFLRDRFQDVQDELRKDDNRLAARDWRGREIPW